MMQFNLLCILLSLVQFAAADNRNCSLYSADYTLLDSFYYPKELFVFGVDIFSKTEQSCTDETARTISESEAKSFHHYSLHSEANVQHHAESDTTYIHLTSTTAGMNVIQKVDQKISEVGYTDVNNALQSIWDVTKNSVVPSLRMLSMAVGMLSSSVIGLAVNVAQLTGIQFIDQSQNNEKVVNQRRERTVNQVLKTSPTSMPSVPYQFAVKNQPLNPGNQMYSYSWIAFQYSDFAYEIVTDKDPVECPNSNGDIHTMRDCTLSGNCDSASKIRIFTKWIFNRTCELDNMPSPDSSDFPSDWSPIPGCIDSVQRLAYIPSEYCPTVYYNNDGEWNSYRGGGLDPDPYNGLDHRCPYTTSPYIQDSRILACFLHQHLTFNPFNYPLYAYQIGNKYQNLTTMNSIIDVQRFYKERGSITSVDFQGYRSKFLRSLDYNDINLGVYEPTIGPLGGSDIRSTADKLKLIGGDHNQMCSTCDTDVKKNSSPLLFTTRTIGTGYLDFAEQFKHFKDRIIEEQDDRVKYEQLTPALTPVWEPVVGCNPESRHAYAAYHTEFYKVRIYALNAEPGGVDGSSYFVFPRRLPERIGVIFDTNTNTVLGYLDPDLVTKNSYRSIYNFRCTGTTACYPLYHKIPADRLLNVKLYTEAANCGEACRAFTGVPIELRHGTMDTALSSVCFNLPREALRVETLPEGITDICSTPPYTCKDGKGVTTTTTSCTGCLLCFRNSTLCNINAATLFNETSVTVLSAFNTTVVVDIYDRLRTLAEEISISASVAGNAQTKAAQVESTVTALSTTQNDNNQAITSAVQTFSTGTIQRVDQWAAMINDNLKCGSPVAGGIFNLFWNVTGPFGSFMRAFFQDITTLTMIITWSVGPYLLYKRYQAAKLASGLGAVAPDELELSSNSYKEKPDSSNSNKNRTLRYDFEDDNDTDEFLNQEWRQPRTINRPY